MNIIFSYNVGLLGTGMGDRWLGLARSGVARAPRPRGGARGVEGARQEEVVAVNP